MVSLFRVIACCLALTLLFSPPGRAADDCAQARLHLQGLQSQTQALEQQRRQLDALWQGQPLAPAVLSPLLGAPLPRASAPPAPPPLSPPGFDCPSLNTALRDTQAQLQQLSAALHQRIAALLALSPVQKRALWTLLADYQALRDEADNTSGGALLVHQLRAVIALIPRLDSKPPSARKQLESLWQQSTTWPRPTDAGLQQRQQRLIDQIGRLRADTWQRYGIDARLQQDDALEAIPSLLVQEARFARLIAQLALNDIQHLSSADTGKGHLPLISNLLALILGAIGFAVLITLARRSRRAALTAHDKVLRWAGERRWLWNLSRLLSGLAPLLPWLIIWLALDGLERPLDAPSTRLLHWLLPLARLYVVFGVLWLLGEWIVLRIAQGAGTYLNNEQARDISHQARTVAAWQMPAWLALLASQSLLGHSLIYSVSGMAVLVFLYLGLARLLSLRADDYRACLQTLLPSRLDPLVAVLLHPRAFWLVAPLLLPLALLGFAVSFGDRLLTDFDWYVRLKARWFRLRTLTADDEDTEQSKQDDHYERWFGDVMPDDTTPPVIDTGLVGAIEKSIQRWHDDETDENTLLLHGEKGAGKSLSLTKLQQRLQESRESLRIVSVSVPAKTTTPGAVNHLLGEVLGVDLQHEGPAALVKSDEDRPPTLLILDEAQNFFLAKTGGLDGWRTLLALINARLDNVFWLVVMNNQSWAYLCNVFGREYQFRNLIRVKHWDQSELRSLILSRHHRSGYQLSYNDVLLSSRGPEAGNVRNAEQRYFSLLWDACRGNPMVALQLWLTSARARGRDVQISLPRPPDTGVLDGMADNLLFVYAAIITHENLATGEITTVTNLPENVVRYALKAGYEVGFLRKDDGGRYRLASLWYQPVIQYLTRKNLLNE